MTKDDDDHSWSVDGGESSSDGEIRPYGMDDIEQEKAEEAAVAEITKRETRGVQMWRLFTLVILIAVSATVSTISYRLLNDQDVNEFEDSVSVAAFISQLKCRLRPQQSLTLVFKVCIFRSSHPKRCQYPHCGRLQCRRNSFSAGHQSGDRKRRKVSVCYG
jgi:hypothetical protein